MYDYSPKPLRTIDRATAETLADAIEDHPLVGHRLIGNKVTTSDGQVYGRSMYDREEVINALTSVNVPGKSRVYELLPCTPQIFINNENGVDYTGRVSLTHLIRNEGLMRPVDPLDLMVLYVVGARAIKEMPFAGIEHTYKKRFVPYELAQEEIMSALGRSTSPFSVLGELSVCEPYEGGLTGKSTTIVIAPGIGPDSPEREVLAEWEQKHSVTYDITNPALIAFDRMLTRMHLNITLPMAEATNEMRELRERTKREGKTPKLIRQAERIVQRELRDGWLDI